MRLPGTGGLFRIMRPHSVDSEACALPSVSMNQNCQRGHRLLSDGAFCMLTEIRARQIYHHIFVVFRAAVQCLQQFTGGRTIVRPTHQTRVV